jgi:sugar phosphate isomerase/epimerase
VESGAQLHPGKGDVLGNLAATAGIPVVLSTASVFPERVPDAFETAARLGYDGLEVMVTTDPVSQDASVLARLSEYHGIPVVAVHAPNLLVTQRVWGRDAWGKLRRSQEMAERLGARVIVVHPPFRWQREYAREFEAGLTRMSQDSGIAFAAENMYPLRSDPEVTVYAPHWDPVQMDCPHATLDVSHAAVSGSDVLEMASQLGPRLAHVHLGDGTKAGLPDEHLVPGRGTQPCAELLSLLYSTGYRGLVVLEVNTHRALDVAQREADLAASLEFARKYLGGAPPPPRAADPATGDWEPDTPDTTARDATAPNTPAPDITGAPGWR